jgi:predicted ATPase
MRPLNVLIGRNGVGKSNLLEALSLLRSAPEELSAPVKEAGGVRDWLWKGSTRKSTALIEAVLDTERPEAPIRHSIAFAEHGERFEVEAELIENRDPYPGHKFPYFFYKMVNGHPILTELPSAGGEGVERPLPRESIHPEKSILAQVRDPERYPMLTYLSGRYSSMRFYREWTFGRYTPPRQSQKATLPHDNLMENCENLALVLNSIRLDAEDVLKMALDDLYPGIGGFHTSVEGGEVSLLLREGKFRIPATRLSDGTLRYLCLLAILCHPAPPPFICIEEPELGLHPDVLPGLARLLVLSSEKTQLVVTTHSDILVDALSETPESVLTCEKGEEGTRITRLDGTALRDWLKTYRLGQLWVKGKIGGTRW